jgi:hypothetical protein
MAAIDSLRLQHSDVSLKVAVAQSSAAAVSMARSGGHGSGVGAPGSGPAKPTSLMNSVDVTAIKQRRAREQQRQQQTLQHQIQQQQRAAGQLPPPVDTGATGPGSSQQLQISYDGAAYSAALSVSPPSHGSAGGGSPLLGGSGSFPIVPIPGGGGGSGHTGVSSHRATHIMGTSDGRDRPLTSAGAHSLRSPPHTQHRRRNSSVDATAAAPMLPPIAIAQPYAHFMPPVGKAIGLGGPQQQGTSKQQQQQQAELPPGSYASGGPFMYHPSAGQA